MSSISDLQIQGIGTAREGNGPDTTGLKKEKLSVN